MKVKIKDRRMKQRVVVLQETCKDDDTLWDEDTIWVVKVEPIYGGIFGDI